MKKRVLTVIAGLLLGATACTPEEIAWWERHLAEQEHAAPATAVRVEVVTPENCPEIAVADRSSLEYSYVKPYMGVWHRRDDGALVGFSRYEDSPVFPTEACAEAQTP